MRALMQDAISEFFKAVEARQASIYNEISLQHEVGVFLRGALDKEWTVEFERPVGFFGMSGLVKKEIDIVVYRRDLSYKAALELKFPRNGQYPEQMFKACQDISFIEQLVAQGFQLGVFVMAVEDHLFRTGQNREGIYSFFRGAMPMSGEIIKPTGARDERVSVKGPHHVKWSGGNDLTYAAVFVEPTNGDLAAH
jgi:hypothetical protein